MLLTMTNKGSDQSVKQPISRRSKGTLLGCPRDIGHPSITPNLHITILMWWISNVAAEIRSKIRDNSLLVGIDPQSTSQLYKTTRVRYVSREKREN